MKSRYVARPVAATFLLAIVAFVNVTASYAHDPKRKNRKPTKAAELLKRAREKMDQGKAKLAGSGKYACCIKPSCDMCARVNGSCNCAMNVRQGKGACGECLEGWQAGLGALKGVDPQTVKLLPAPAQKIESDLPPPDELTVAREAMNAAKKVLVNEGSYACCVRGGCDSCAHGADCPCGSNLAAAPAATQKKAASKEEGVCGECLDGWHSGHGAFQGIALSEVQLAEMEMAMPSSFGTGTMMRQGSGTSWLPESTPMHAFMQDAGEWMLMWHPYAFTTFTHQSGPRGDQKFYSSNWLMASAQREVRGLTGKGSGTLLVRGMLSLDPLTVGRSGYPLLFQTGESNRGRRLVDRQHPHDLFMELAIAYSAPVTEGLVLSLYAAPIGEPALGPSAFPHRVSAMDNPEAPLSHHWQDSTHIASGVATAGLAGEKWKIESSIFTGAEPDENRWNIDRPKFDSWSTRLSVNPSRDLSLQVSYGHLREPEALEPGINAHRITASAIYNRAVGSDSNWATTFVWGRNEKHGAGHPGYGTNAFLVESAYSFKDRHSFFMRFELAEKDELLEDDEFHHDAPEIFRIKRLTVGAVHNLPLPGPMEFGVGGSLSLHAFPSELKPIYGSNPISTNLFIRIRPKRWGSL